MFKRFIKRFKRNDRGQALTEYGVILALVSIVAIGSLTGVGGKVSDSFGKVVDAIDTSEGLSDEKIRFLIDDNYIPVASAAELVSIRRKEVQLFGKGTKWEGEYLSGLDKKYIQVSNINLDVFENFEPIGNFTGVFNGGELVMSNLTINKPNKAGVGLFSNSHGAKFENMRLENVDVTGEQNVGGLVGILTNPSSVEYTHIINSYVTGKVSGYMDVGGLVGYQHLRSKIINSYSTADVTGIGYDPRHVGGLVGESAQSSIESSYATGDVIGVANVGGLVGSLSISSVDKSYSTGNVKGILYVGGLAGAQFNGSSINNSYAAGKVSENEVFENGQFIAGLAGGFIGGNGEDSGISDSGWLEDSVLGLDGIGQFDESSTSSNLKSMTKSEINKIIKELIK